MKVLKASPCSFKSTRNRDSRNLNVNCLLDFHVKHLFPPVWLQPDYDFSLLMNIMISQLCVMEAVHLNFLKFVVYLRYIEWKEIY